MRPIFRWPHEPDTSDNELTLLINLSPLPGTSRSRSAHPRFEAACPMRGREVACVGHTPLRHPSTCLQRVATLLPPQSTPLTHRLHTSRSSYGASAHCSTLPHQPLAALDVAGRDTCTAMIGTRACLRPGLVNAPEDTPDLKSTSSSGAARCPPIIGASGGEGMLMRG
jgi:hypothetical protein